MVTSTLSRTQEEKAHLRAFFELFKVPVEEYEFLDEDDINEHEEELNRLLDRYTD